MILFEDFLKYYNSHGLREQTGDPTRTRVSGLREERLSKICWHCKKYLGTLDYIMIGSINDKRKEKTKFGTTPILYFHEECFIKIAGDEYFIEVPK